MEADKKRYTISRETSTSFGEALERARTLLQEAGYEPLRDVGKKRSSASSVSRT